MKITYQTRQKFQVICDFIYDCYSKDITDNYAFGDKYHIFILEKIFKGYGNPKTSYCILVSDNGTSCDLHISIIGFKVKMGIFDNYSYETIPAEIITADKNYALKNLRIDFDKTRMYLILDKTRQYLRPLFEMLQ